MMTTTHHSAEDLEKRCSASEFSWERLDKLARTMILKSCPVLLILLKKIYYHLISIAVVV